MAIKKSELYSSLWASCDELRGGMDPSQYKDYVLVFLFLKYISDKYAGQPFAPITIPAGAGFDDMASLKRYKERIFDIEEELEEAIAFDREEEIEQLEKEKDSILKHLSEVSGTSGRSRLKGEKEKARQSVLRAFKRMFASLPLGRDHIESRLKTGYTCTYTPDAGEVWKVDFPKSN